MSSLLVFTFTVQATALASGVYTDNPCSHHHGLHSFKGVCTTHGLTCFSNPWLPWYQDQDQTWLLHDTRPWYTDSNQPTAMTNGITIGPRIYIPIILLSLKLLLFLCWLCYCCCCKGDSVGDTTYATPVEAGQWGTGTPLTTLPADEGLNPATSDNNSTTPSSSVNPPAATDQGDPPPPPSYNEAVHMESAADVKVDRPQQNDTIV